MKYELYLGQPDSLFEDPISFLLENSGALGIDICITEVIGSYKSKKESGFLVIHVDNNPTYDDSRTTPEVITHPIKTLGKRYKEKYNQECFILNAKRRLPLKTRAI